MEASAVIGYAVVFLVGLIVGRVWGGAAASRGRSRGNMIAPRLAPTAMPSNVGASVLPDAAFEEEIKRLVAAGKLGLTQHRFIPHPINEDWLRDQQWQELRRTLRAQLKSDFIVFHPPRQHWESIRHPDWEKGNDIFIHGFARFVREICPTAAAIFVAWGKFVQLQDQTGKFIAQRLFRTLLEEQSGQALRLSPVLESEALVKTPRVACTRCGDVVSKRPIKGVAHYGGHPRDTH